MTQRRSDERGAAAVEFALVMLPLMVIVFGIIAYGFVFAQSLSLSNSARQAARSGVVAGTPCKDIVRLATDSADTLGMDGAQAVVEVKRGTAESSAAAFSCTGTSTTEPCDAQPTGTNLYVKLTYTGDPVVPMIPVPDSLSGKGVFRCEFS